MSAAPKKVVHVTFNRNYVPTWAFDHIKYFNGGQASPTFYRRMSSQEEREIPDVVYLRKVSHRMIAQGGDGKEQGNGMANFDCNVCLDVAKEPVVPSCGHLFWLAVFISVVAYSPRDHRECLVCKGEVIEPDITPIYGRGNSKKESGKRGKEVDSGL
ncbi:hypothetical protein IFM89_031822 [Coptis chinensis]|uniref:E3 ubiquitin-protein ligase RMA n=1 Tax=Coptis chinensis TaxID=261450 RepID=A0A835LXB0_9MAGN|nr:hypothetical protein IFM89_031822 [Coptis chinensis]